MLLTNLKTLAVNSVRFLIAIVFCTLLFISSAFPAAAATSKPTEGETKLTEIQRKTDEVAESAPLDMKGVQEKGGINEVQGEADQEKMVRPANPNVTDVKPENKGTLR